MYSIHSIQIQFLFELTGIIAFSVCFLLFLFQLPRNNTVFPLNLNDIIGTVSHWWNNSIAFHVFFCIILFCSVPCFWVVSYTEKKKLFLYMWNDRESWVVFISLFITLVLYIVTKASMAGVQRHSDNFLSFVQEKIMLAHNKYSWNFFTNVAITCFHFSIADFHCIFYSNVLLLLRQWNKCGRGRSKHSSTVWI